MSKHKLKLALRDAWARLLWVSGLHSLVQRCSAPRVLVLAGHCVSAPSNASLSKDMKIRATDLERILATFARRYDILTMGEAAERLRSGRLARSAVVLTMDDGYADNLTHLAPLLARLGAKATIYLETRALTERRLNWTHGLFLLLDHMGHERFVARYRALARDERGVSILEETLRLRGGDTYHIKRVLKYEVDRIDRERVLEAMLSEEGLAARELCERLYLTWEQARELAREGHEIGAHTESHAILSRCSPDEQRREIEGSRDAIARELGAAPVSFAYPFGREWDWDEHAARAVMAAGYTSSTTTHPGTNRPGADMARLKRVMIDEDVRLELLVAEACGGFDLLRRLGFQPPA
jgi:peptidoglycan/xylan/chitin deacetylase (PgdA/CDA1 family)